MRCIDNLRALPLTVAIVAIFAIAAGAQDAGTRRTDGAFPIRLPPSATLVGTYQRPIPLAGFTDYEYPNDLPQACLLDPQTRRVLRVPVNAAGAFHFDGLQPGHSYHLALIDSFRYLRGYHGKAGFGPEPGLGANSMNGVYSVTETRHQFQAERTVVDARASWHQTVTPRHPGTFAIALGRHNVDARFSGALWPGEGGAAYRPARLISVGEP